MIISYAVYKSDKFLLNQLPQIVSTKFEMLHFILSNKVINNLNNALIVTIESG
jgi:hypothetical protein